MASTRGLTELLGGIEPVGGIRVCTKGDKSLAGEEERTAYKRRVVSRHGDRLGERRGGHRGDALLAHHRREFLRGQRTRVVGAHGNGTPDNGLQDAQHLPDVLVAAEAGYEGERSGEWEIMELWNYGIMGLWDYGIGRMRNGGVREWGIVELWNYGIMGLWDYGIGRLGNGGVREWGSV